MRQATDHTGQVFGRLTAIERAGSTPDIPRRPLWRCRCECGGEIIARAPDLRTGATRSCGCLRVEAARASSANARAARLASRRAT